jgi:hypothetical protein
MTHPVLTDGVRHQAALSTSILRAVALSQHWPIDIAHAMGRRSAEEIFNQQRRLQAVQLGVLACCVRLDHIVRQPAKHGDFLLVEPTDLYSDNVEAS